MMVTSVISIEDDLVRLVEEINQASWDEANEMCEFDADALLAYLTHQDTVFVACHAVSEGESTLLGIASSRYQIKPYNKERWLYVDEVDVCADHRQKGAGKAIMRKLVEIANEADCGEVWLGTEVDNEPANALYRSLGPDEVAQVTGYTYETD